MKKRVLSLLLAFLLVFTGGVDQLLAVALPFADDQPTLADNQLMFRSEKEEMQKGTDGQNYIFSFQPNADSGPRRVRRSLFDQPFYEDRAAEDMGDQPFYADRAAGDMIDQPFNIVMGGASGLDGAPFNWDVLPEGLRVQVGYYDSTGQHLSNEAVVFTEGDTAQKVITMPVPADVTDINSFFLTTPINEDVNIRAYVDSSTGMGGNREYTFTLELVEINDPTINVVWQDAEGNLIAGSDGAFLTVYVDGEEISVPVPANSGAINLLNQTVTEDGEAYPLFYKDGFTEDFTFTVEGMSGDGSIQVGTNWYNAVINEKTVTFTAQANVVPQPGTDKPDVPANYIRVEFLPGDNGLISAGTTIYWVNPEVEVDLTGSAPTVLANDGYVATGWDTNLVGIFAVDTNITAQYVAKIVPTDPDNPSNPPSDSHHLAVFDAGEGSFADGAKKVAFWVHEDTTLAEVKAQAADNPTAPTGTNFDAWQENGAVVTFDTAVFGSGDRTFTASYVAQLPSATPVITVPSEGDTTITVTAPSGGNMVVTIDTITVPAEKIVDNGNGTYTVTVDTELIKGQTVGATFTENGKLPSDATPVTVIGNVVPQEGEDKPNVPDSYVQVDFAAGDHGSLTGTTIYWVNPTAVVDLTSVAPQVTPEEGYTFTGWDKALSGTFGTATTITAQYTTNVVPQEGEDKPNVPDSYVQVDFAAGDHGSLTGTTIYWVNPTAVVDLTSVAPQVTPEEGYTFTGWDKALSGTFGTATTITAQYTTNVVPQEGEDKPNVPDSYVQVDFAAGDHGSLTGTTIYWVNPTAVVDLTSVAPQVTPEEGYTFTGWDKALSGTFGTATTITAQYTTNVVPQEGEDKPNVPDSYVQVDFAAGDHGSLTGTTIYWVNPTAVVDLTSVAPQVTPEEGYTFTGWDKALSGTFGTATTITAQYTTNVVPQEGEDKPNVPDSYVQVDFAAGDHGSLTGTTIYWVNPTAVVDLTSVAPQVTPEEGYTFTGWDKALSGTFGTATTITAQYTTNVVPQEGEDKPNVPDSYVQVDFAAGDHGSLTGTTIYWVNPTAVVDLTSVAPQVTPEEGYTFTGWDKALSGTFGTATTITAQYALDNASEYGVTYPPVVVPTTGTVSVDPTITYPEGTTTLPNGTAFSIDPSFTAPDGITVTIDATTGEITITTDGADETTAPIDVPVIVTYPDDSKDNGELEITVRDSYTLPEPTPNVVEGVEEKGDKPAITPGEGVTILPKDPQDDEHGIAVDEDGNIIGTPNVDDWGDKEDIEVTVPVDLDTDGDGDVDETVDVPVVIQRDTDGDGIADVVDLDDDNDGINDKDEEAAGLDPKDPDSDHDGIKDGDEDEDHDGILNKDESDPNGTTITDKNGNGIADLIDPADHGNDNPLFPWLVIGPTQPEAKEERSTHVAYINGYPDGSVQPDGNMTRAEAAAMLARLKGYTMTNDVAPNFTDTPSDWYNTAINAVVEHGLMNGYPDGSFHPNAPITRAEFAKMIQSIDRANSGDAPFADVENHWGEAAIDQAYGNGRIAGYPDGTFKPDNNITRAEAAKMLNSLFERMVRARGLDDVADDVRNFNDLYNGHWGYYELVEATNTHTYVRVDKGAVEELWRAVLNQR
ncbi:S-layer homology domain-containing protein [Peptoniphilus equinus]|uniref:S-layer homology domain-containing protein n=1 Tax=Peptoniphilus equinus TaxID=3016343 RepID=A0ABY7QUR4_9FIRM|nr:S-layer homology domain-containing protein [Peptoniphilus equinus]WBW50514.1 S-layer homology domain-containing protein [Peptoniphilus equinus]